MKDEPHWYQPTDQTPHHPCSCCDYVTLAERSTYLICPVCYWEDDGVDPDQPDAPSAANKGLTLRQARKNFSVFGACEPAVLVHVCSAEDRAVFERVAREVS